MAFFVTSCILVPLSGKCRELLFSGSALWSTALKITMIMEVYHVLSLCKQMPRAGAYSSWKKGCRAVWDREVYIGL